MPNIREGMSEKLKSERKHEEQEIEERIESRVKNLGEECEGARREEEAR